jgi:filamentous hemagglutinin
MGYVKLHERSKGEAIYRKGRRYISRDLDGHNGGAWKMGYISDKLRSRTTRLGTYNKDLTQRVGD